MKFAILLSAPACMVSAQTRLDHVSLEELVNRSPVVVLAKISSVDSPGRSFTIEVKEVLKGRATTAVVLFAGPGPRSTRELQFRSQSGQYDLYFYDPNSRGTWGSYPLGRDDLSKPPDQIDRLGFDEARFDVGFGYRLFSLDLTVVRTRDEAIRRVRRFARSHPTSLKSYNMRIPGAVARTSGWSVASDHIDLPICEELEATCLRIIARPGEYVPTLWKQPTFFFDIAMGRSRATMEAVLREAAIGCLANFKSVRNILTLKKLLNDPGVVVPEWSVEGMKYPETRSFAVRDAAAKVLNGWDTTAMR